MEVLTFFSHSLLGTINLQPVKSPDGGESGMVLIMFHFAFRQIFVHLGCQSPIIPEH